MRENIQNSRDSTLQDKQKNLLTKMEIYKNKKII